MVPNRGAQVPFAHGASPGLHTRAVRRIAHLRQRFSGENPVSRAFLPRAAPVGEDARGASHIAMTIIVPQATPLAASDGLNYLEIARNSGPVGLAVLFILLVASAVCWAIIFRKWLQIRRAHEQSIKFLEAFWQSRRLDAIYQAAESLAGSPLSHVFRAGYVELSKVTAQKKETGPGESRGMSEELGGIENVERALKRAAASEVTALERQVPFLGTTASAAPFVGLFGTVWGIMNAFHDIYRMGNANLATVARPISEALIATAVGLFAAIPAVVAYNFFVSKIRVLDSEMTNFSNDFLNIVKRHFFS
jgi:biopolymer transport protein TolQ